MLRRDKGLEMAKMVENEMMKEGGGERVVEDGSVCLYVDEALEDAADEADAHGVEDHANKRVEDVLV